MLDGVKAGALGEHPAGEDALDLAGELDLVHFHEGGGVRRLRRRAAVADARRHLQRAELHRLIDRDLQMRDPARHLVQRGEYRDRILDLVGKRRARCQHARERKNDPRPSEWCAAPSGFTILHHAAHCLNSPPTRATPLSAPRNSWPRP
jgi:hypothetical protein